MECVFPQSDKILTYKISFAPNLGVHHYFIHQHLQRYRSFTATFRHMSFLFTWIQKIITTFHITNLFKPMSFDAAIWCIKNHPMDFLFFSISPKSSTFRRPRSDNCHWYPGCLRGSTRRCDIFFPASDADDELSAWSCATAGWKNPRERRRE